MTERDLLWIIPLMILAIALILLLIILSKVEGREESPARLTVAVYDYETIRFRTYSDAHTVLDELFDQLESHGKVTVSDLYFYSGVRAFPRSVYKNYGWTCLDGVEITTDQDGWMLDLPRVQSLNKKEKRL